MHYEKYESYLEFYADELEKFLNEKYSEYDWSPVIKMARDTYHYQYIDAWEWDYGVTICMRNMKIAKPEDVFQYEEKLLSHQKHRFTKQWYTQIYNLFESFRNNQSEEEVNQVSHFIYTLYKMIKIGFDWDEENEISLIECETDDCDDEDIENQKSLHDEIFGYLNELEEKRLELTQMEEDNRFGTISLQGRLFYICMCIERYLLSLYSDRDWSSVGMYMWNLVKDSDFFENIGEYANRTAGFILQYENFDEYNKSGYGTLSKDEYEKIVALYDGIAKGYGKGESELTNVLEIPIDFVSDCEVTNYDLLSVMKNVSLIYIAKLEKILQAHNIELPNWGLGICTKNIPILFNSKLVVLAKHKTTSQDRNYNDYGECRKIYADLLEIFLAVKFPIYDWNPVNEMAALTYTGFIDDWQDNYSDFAKLDIIKPEEFDDNIFNVPKEWHVRLYNLYENFKKNQSKEEIELVDELIRNLSIIVEIGFNWGDDGPIEISENDKYEEYKYVCHINRETVRDCIERLDKLLDENEKTGNGVEMIY